MYLDDPPADGEETMTERRYRETLKLRIGGFDHRKQRFKGWVEIERYLREEVEYSFILMRRDEVCFILVIRLGGVIDV